MKQADAPEPSADGRLFASRTLVLAAVVSVPVGLLNLVFPHMVDPSVWGHPYDPVTQVVVSMVLVVAHLLKAHGFVVGLSRLDGAGPVVRWSMWVAALGFTIVAACEGVSATLYGTPMTDPAVARLNDGYGVGSMLLAVGSMVGGTVIGRQQLLDGPGRWSVFLSGAFMLFVVTPALILERGPAAYLSLTAWSLFYVWIGRTLGRTLRR